VGTVVVAGLCARWLAESARQAGWQVIALDLFGDADTQRASLRWERIGDPARCTIEPALLRPALQQAARSPGVIGWVAGSGFEGLTEALDLQVPGLPLLGMAGAAVRRVRDPASFFPLLDRLGLDHPEVALDPPPTPDGWLLKSAAGCGGWHIRHAGADACAPGAYWQRFQPGEPMSALFLADGRNARLVALNHLLVRPLGVLPHVYSGAVGPIQDEALQGCLEDALAQLVPALELRGLASLDFIAHEGRAWLLEVNPRPSASMALHGRAWPGGLLRAHVRALHGELPAAPAEHPPGLRGCQVIYADRACRVGLALAAELARSTECHDVPAPGARFGRGDPICSVSAAATRMEAVLAELELRAGLLRSRLGRPEALAA
jgi:predicted ATP-grasp superfamily ATP-dependent carboligase